MGKMKELYIEICNANNGMLPPELSIEDAVRMRELEIYEWKEYIRKKESLKTKDSLKKDFGKFDYKADLRSSKDDLEPF